MKKYKKKYNYIDSDGNNKEITEVDVRKLMLYSLYPSPNETYNFGFTSTIRKYMVKKHNDTLWDIYDKVISKLDEKDKPITAYILHNLIKESCKELGITIKSLRVITKKMAAEIETYIEENGPKVNKWQKKFK